MELIYDPVRARIAELQRTAGALRQERSNRAETAAAVATNTTTTTPATTGRSSTPRIEPDLRQGPCAQPTSTVAAR